MKTPKDRAEKLLEAIFSKVERIEGIVEKALTATRSSITSRASPGGLELSEIKRQLGNIQESLSKSANAELAMAKHHYLWFFPDLKEWLDTVRRGKFVTLFSLLSLALLVFIYLKYPDHKEYQEGYYKYQYLFYASDDAESLKKYDQEWGVDSVREMRVRWVKEQGL